MAYNDTHKYWFIHWQRCFFNGDLNTALLGTFACLSRELSLEAVLKAVRSKFPGELGEKNGQIVQESYREFLTQTNPGNGHKTTKTPNKAVR